ncbi:MULTISPECIES: GNAT family N-acetyltransferase [unclassified Pseudomonas]|uniref:GNAT family N-acetyltransferase n=1 Tax=unclassified Pseudomonas TaxID=196821 RepID=UPI00258014B8|nr:MULTISPECIES: GNAT family N-acetyltransferase [unclassified Pseudomonas]
MLTAHLQANTHASLSLRPQAEADVALLRALFVARRAGEFAAMPWSDAEREAFLHAQADLQSRHYAQHYPHACMLVIEQHSQAIGRLGVNEGADELRVIDIALLPAWQGKGIGSSLLHALLAWGDRHGKACTLSVDQANPAQALYRRLGFDACADPGLYLQMRRPPMPARP